MSGKASQVAHIRSSSNSNPRSVEEGGSTLCGATQRLRSKRTIQFSKHEGVRDHKCTGCSGNNKKVASDTLPSKKNGLPERCVLPVIFNGETRPQIRSSASKTTIFEKSLAGPDRCLGESFFHNEDAELDEDKLARPISPFKLVESYKSDSSVYVIDSDDLECPTGYPAADAAAMYLPRDPTLKAKESISLGVSLRGGALSNIEFWNSETRKMLLLGQDGPYKDKLLTGSISIDNTIHDYLGGARVQVHVRSSDNPHFYDGRIRLNASHHTEELIIAKNAFRHTFARAARDSERLDRLAKVAETFIVSACFTMWHNDIFWGIEIPNEHLWMVQELCTESWRITCPERNTASVDTAGRDRRKSITDGQIEGQIHDAMVAQSCKRVSDDKLVTELSEAYAEDDIPELEITESALFHGKAWEEMQEQPDAERSNTTA